MTRNVKWLQTAGTITAKEIKTHYNGISGADLLTARRRLEILGYIEPVRKGSQRYRLLRGSIPSLDDLTTEYTRTCYTYNMPADYHRHVELPLKTLARQFKVWNSGNWGAMNEPIAKASEQLSQAVDKLPGLNTPFYFTFACLPVYDPLIVGYGREKKLANIACLLDVTARNLRDLYYQPVVAGELETVAEMLRQIKVPDRYKFKKEAA